MSNIVIEIIIKLPFLFLAVTLYYWIRALASYPPNEHFVSRLKLTEEQKERRKRGTKYYKKLAIALILFLASFSGVVILSQYVQI